MKTNYIEQAIRKAQEGGFRPTYFSLRHLHNVHCDTELFLDPNFWQSLGKALGWSETLKSLVASGRWLIEWHQFIDHLAAGKDPNDYFKEILEPNLMKQE